uniref:Ubiquitin-conjugating enzyme E2 2 n=1 Tax=Ganoderma boninense TaxID=34458 RepID=A0A5K1JZP1_9APHY|nr:Ubiquitin-conjugating enzyme E2 2 [Ganoderma boninense]
MMIQSSNSHLIIHRITPQQTVPLRHSVLWPNHPVSYVLLPEDDSGKHYGAFLDGVCDAVAVVSVFEEAFSQPMPDGGVGCVPALRFRKFACDPKYQGQGIGTQLLRHVFDDALSNPKIPIRVFWCDARVSAATWYERKEIGMERFGEVFFKGDIEYIRMKGVVTIAINLEGTRRSAVTEPATSRAH